MIEVTVRQHYRLDLAKVQAHPANVAFECIGIATGVEEDRSLLCA